MTQTPGAALLAGYIETWHGACRDFLRLARQIDEAQADRPTDLAGWSVRDNVAHTAHLEAVLAGAPEETIEVPDSPHVRGPMSRYTEQGVLARRGRTVAELADELEDAVDQRHAALRTDPPTDPAGRPAATFAGMPWDNQTLLGNRPLDVWMHEQDIRRAVGRPGGMNTPGADHTISTFARSFPYIVGKRVAPAAGTTVVLDVTGVSPIHLAVEIDESGRAVPMSPDPADPTVTLRMDVETFAVLGGGRRSVADLPVEIEGDQELGRRILEAAAVTP